MRHLSTPAQGLLLVLFLAACTGAPAATPTVGPGATSPAATQVPPVATAPPAATQPPGGATQPPVGLTGHECDAVPTFNLSDTDPATPPPDTALIAHFPSTIDGQPVTDVQSIQWLYFICLFGGQQALNQAASEAGGLNLTTLGFGSATATVDGEEVDLVAFRTPGQDANALVQALATLAAQSGADFTTGAVTAANVGGKNVFVWTDEAGANGYAFASGDTLVIFEDVTDSQAAKIVAALP